MLLEKYTCQRQEGKVRRQRNVFQSLGGVKRRRSPDSMELHEKEWKSRVEVEAKQEHQRVSEMTNK
jgi:hypothetical protein